MIDDYTLSDWKYINQGNCDMEFDWIGEDASGQIALFSTFNRAYIPACVTTSYEQYCDLAKLINSLPFITTALKRIKDTSANLEDFQEYCERGLFAYDIFDIHRGYELHKYDLLFEPKQPLIASKIQDLATFQNIIPVFNFVFSNDVSFESLKKDLENNIH